MIVTGIDLRGEQVACAMVEYAGGRAQMRAAEVVPRAELSELVISGTAMLLAEAETCYRVRQQLPALTKVRNFERFAMIAAANADRPGGKRKAAVVEQRDREVVVGLANLVALESTRRQLESTTGVSVGIADPAAAWMALTAMRGGGPEVIVDDFADPAQVIVCDPEGSWVYSEVESIPRGSLTQRATAVATILQQGVLMHRPIRTIGVAGRLVDAMEILIASLAGDVAEITPLVNAAPWWPALGAALVPLMGHSAHMYEEIRGDSMSTL